MSGMDQQDRTKRSTLREWSWRRQRLLRARIRARYPHVSRRGWHKCVRAIIYIPAAAERHIPPSKRTTESTLLAELERLSALNVPWACAILSYKALLRRDDGSRDIERAISLCERPAQAGDPYAQYLLSWALLLKGDATGAAKNMLKSARKLFPPAVLDLSNFRSPAWDQAQASKELLLRFEMSERVGHAGTLSRKLHYLRTGNAGTWRLTSGYLLVPVALLRYLLAAVFFPFSADVFFFLPSLSVKALRFR
jgi:hypothetical protein